MAGVPTTSLRFKDGTLIVIAEALSALLSAPIGFIRVNKNPTHNRFVSLDEIREIIEEHA